MGDVYLPNLQSLFYFAIAGGRSYLIDVCGMNDDFERRGEEIDAVIASFKIIDAK